MLLVRNCQGIGIRELFNSAYLWSESSSWSSCDEHKPLHNITDLHHASRSLSSSNTENSSPLAVDTICVTAPEQEDVHDVQVAHAGRGEQGGLALLVCVVHVSLVLQEDLTDATLAWK